MLFSTRDLNHFDGAESVTLYPKIIPNMLESTMNYGLVTTAGPLPLPPQKKKKKKKKKKKYNYLLVGTLSCLITREKLVQTCEWIFTAKLAIFVQWLQTVVPSSLHGNHQKNKGYNNHSKTWLTILGPGLLGFVRSY